MQTLNESSLSGLLKAGINLKLVEPHIYSVYDDLESTNSYDKRFGSFYDWVACSFFYNWIVWGYSTSAFATINHDTLTSSKDGFVLDVGCGSLAFSAKTYTTCIDRPVILLDQSLKLLRMAKTRLKAIHGSIPANMVFLHADALQLPFRPGVFKTIVSLNLLHVLNDLKATLNGFKNVLAKEGTMTFTTLVRNNRLADRYLKFWENAGEVVSRDIADIKAAFDELGIPASLSVSGNMAFIRCN